MAMVSVDIRVFRRAWSAPRIDANQFQATISRSSYNISLKPARFTTTFGIPAGRSLWQGIIAPLRALTGPINGAGKTPVIRADSAECAGPLGIVTIRPGTGTY